MKLHVKMYVLGLIWFVVSGLQYTQAQNSSQLTSQDFTTVEQQPCSHTFMHERLMQENEVYRQEQIARENSLQLLLAKPPAIAKDDEILTIPVVVHIVHLGEPVGTGTNISDEQVYSAINALNQQFRKMPGTLGDGNGVDTGIEFCLAQQDPNGNAHSGITRVDGTSVLNYAEEGITGSGNGLGASELAIKNLSRWPNDEYYNIWVVSEIGNNGGYSGVQAYAYFPTTSPVDGAVVLFNAFGTVGNLKSYTNENKTITHEMGHAFALYHTFQGGICDEVNCILQGDRVCDTPPTVLNSNCSSPACGGNQQIENYLDYTNQSCKNMFTQGQKERMRTSIFNARSSLLNSTRCQAPTPLTADASITDITSPFGNLCTNAFQPEVILKNSGSNPMSSTDIKYRINNGSWFNYHWNGLLGSGQETNIVLPLITGPWGENTLQVKVENPNGNTDSNTANDLKSKTFAAVNGDHTLSLDITLDMAGTETTWKIFNSDNDIIAQGGPYSNWQTGTVKSYDICVTDGCYELAVYDAAGNGLCCVNGNGSYVLKDETNAVLANGSSFTSSSITEFCFNEETPEPPTAAFNVSQTEICAGSTVSFHNTSAGENNIYSWKFYGGNPFISSAENPTVTYTTPGTYNVRLEVTNEYGQDILLNAGYITVNESQEWFADTDNDGHGDPNASVMACSQPIGFVANGTDCNDTDINDWNSCYDCMGTMNGNAFLDHCGVCDANPNNNCVQDCLGEWGGNAVMDECGVCDANPNNDCQQDCLGEWGGNAVMDECGVCDANPSNDCQQDCLGEWGGNAVMDNCGVCDANPNNDCEQDCLGEWGGNAVMDECGVCDSDPTNDCIPCSNLSAVVADIQNVSCFGSSDGQASIVVSAPDEYTVTWNNGQTGNTLQNVPAGSYIAIVESSDCSTVVEVEITEPQPINISITNTVPDNCEGTGVGSAEIIVNGGTSPYEIFWNDALMPNGLSVNGLSSGIYVVDVVDAHNCEAQITVIIDQEECPDATTTQLTDEFCNNLALSLNTSVECNPVAGAEQYIWQFTSGSSDPIISYTTVNYLTAAFVTGIQNNVVYQVKVKSVVDEVEQPFGPSCEIMFVTETPQAAPEITDNFCGATDISAGTNIECTNVEGAEQYEWLFENNDRGERFIFNTGTSNFCNPADITAFDTDVLYEVKIRARVNGQWTDYGKMCRIKVVENIPTTALIPSLCGNTGLSYESDALVMEPIEGAVVYQFRIKIPGTNRSMIFHQNSNKLPLNIVHDLQENINYTVDCRVLYNGAYGAWGESCEFGVFGDKELILNVTIYPNPARSGETISLISKNDWKDLEVILYNINGSPMSRWKIDVQRNVPIKYTLPDLKPGIYLIQFRHQNQMLNEKLIIQ